MKNGDRIIAVIPARGGSKRLHKKNIYPVWGQPMINWAIEAAQESKYIKEVYVTTEDEEIKLIAELKGAVVIDRPVELSEDNVFKMDAIRDAVSKLSFKPNVVVSLQANSPEVLAKDLDMAIDKFYEYNRNELFSVDKNLIMNAAFRIMKYETVFQRDLSTKCGAFVVDYVDIHTLEDITKLKDHWKDCLYDEEYEKDPKKALRTEVFWEFVNKQLSINKTTKVLELGCNVGRNLTYAERMYKCKVTGIDISEKQIQIAKTKSNGEFICHDIRDLSVLRRMSDRSFDFGFTMGFLMHMDRDIKEEIIKEMMRICVNVAFFEVYRKGKDVFQKYSEKFTFDDYTKFHKNIIKTNIEEKGGLILFGAFGKG